MMRNKFHKDMSRAPDPLSATWRPGLRGGTTPIHTLDQALEAIERRQVRRRQQGPITRALLLGAAKAREKLPSAQAKVRMPELSIQKRTDL